MSAAARIQRSFRRGFATYDDSALFQKPIARRLTRRLLHHAGDARFARVFEAGYGTGQLTRLLLQRLPIETLSLPDALDLAISTSMIQWIADPQHLIERLCSAVRPGGWLAQSGFGPDHFPSFKL